MSKFDNQVNVVLAADDNYAMQLAVTMFSILRNLNKMSCLQLFILDGGISSKNKNKIKRIFKNNNQKKNHSIIWIKPDLEKLNNLPTKGKPRAIYLPLLIPEYLPDQCNKVIFLDSDLVLESDITKLYKHDVEITPLWAVRDLLIQTLSGKDGIKSYKEIGGTEKSPYFNSGVMLINLDYWRREKVTSGAIDYIQEYKEETRFHDQEALNAALVSLPLNS
ncbi:glycosyltransferase family 8 protein [Aliifodinibius sp. S!AR15-10]|uniref:glycosyltransferase family 8 protein n=1 Tax=Aliifodinibius sp. S!AR15-10 TaxID=2950437 RepID=UPI00285492AA|nr:glycosyltransferase family 8 protein [Aliifodinibius sp. S!AR15-10]MDR8394652.1 glycosyltransferase family 8 protein [Aliifodinibius sp. S!AR15-10]